jgi:L-ascorbate metabolism protein UlaG (beta-lactamase superfamily)
MAGDTRVSFRDAAGKESAADLALVPVEQLAAGRP